MSKSAIYVINSVEGTALTDGSIYPVNQIVRRYGCDILSNGAGITCQNAGYYDIDAIITVTATAAGVLEARLLNNGAPIPGAVSEVTAAADGVVTLPINALVRVACCAVPVDITIELSGIDTTSLNAQIKAHKL